MPIIATCPHPRCFNPLPCTTHNRQPSKIRSGYVDTTTAEEQRFYESVLWRRIRAAHLQVEPFCRECKRQGIVKIGRIVDHIIPRRKGGSDQENNLQTICAPCHNRKRNSEREFH